MSEPHTPEDDYISKTQLKNHMLALQQLGQKLVNLPDAALAKIPLDEELRDAVLLAQRINRKKDGFRRQLQFIGKLMRQRDTSDIEQALTRLNQQHQSVNQHFHLLERLRDNILQGDEQVIEQALQKHSALDRQKIRQLKRQAHKEQAEQKPPKAARELFQYLKQSIAG